MVSGISFLYDLEVTLLDKGKKTDKVKSYAAMRKISMHKDKDGIMRMQLNNKDCFSLVLGSRLVARWIIYSSDRRSSGI